MGQIRQRGLSLLEILFALVLVTVAVLAVVSVYIGGMRLSAKGERLFIASETGKAVLERIREAGFSEIPDGTRTFDGRSNDPQLGDFPPPPYPAQGDYPILVETHLQEANLKSVTVRVFYDKDNSVVLQTYFTPFE